VRVSVIAQQLRGAVPGGIGTYIRGLAQGLRSVDGADITLVATAAGSEPDPVAGLGFPVSTVRWPARGLTRAWDWGLTGIPDEGDVVHATSLAVPWRGRAPRTVMVHDLVWRLVPDAFPRRGRRWHEQAVRRAISRAARLVAPSSATADALLAAGAGADRVVVIEEGCDHLPTADDVRARELLDRLGVHEPYVLSVSTLEPRKNLPRLIEAFSSVRARLGSLVVVGPAGWGPELKPPPGTVAAGHVPDAVLAGLYARARCVAYVPLVEGFGLPAVEAMRAGVPVVASPMPSTNGAALEVDPLDVEALSSALVVAATDESRRAELIAAGSARAAALRWDNTARAHVALWQEIAG
jgi:glycosyltransferase involved in cell wall biosynthesis